MADQFQIVISGSELATYCMYIASYSSTSTDITMRDHWSVTGVLTTHYSVTVMSQNILGQFVTEPGKTGLIYTKYTCSVCALQICQFY